MDNKLKENICSLLAELERLCRAAGDHEIGQELKKILESPNQIGSLHTALIKKLRRRKEQENSLTKRFQFFSNFKSPDGSRLNDPQIAYLVSVTDKWELDEEGIKALQVCSLLWAENPRLFWDGEKLDSSIIRRSFYDLERMREIDPTKRKILLVALSREIEQEQHENTGATRRQRPSRGNDCGRKGHLTSSLHKIFRQHYPGVEGEVKKERRKRFAIYSRYGWKWDQMVETEMILSLAHAPAKRYESHGWKKIELQAINAFVETLPQFCIRSDLLRAWRSLTGYYHIERQADASRAQQSYDPTRNAHSPVRSSYEYSRSLHLENINQNHEIFRAIPITFAPSRSRRRRKRRPPSLDLANKRRRTVDQETYGDDNHVSCLNNGHTPVNLPVMYEHQVPDEQVHALAAPANTPQIDGIFTPVEMHQLSELPSTGVFDLFEFPNTYLFDVFEHSSNFYTENLDNIVHDFVSRIPSH